MTRKAITLLLIAFVACLALAPVGSNAAPGDGACRGFASFPNSAGLTLRGSAQTTAGALRLTPATSGQMGAAWSTTSFDLASGALDTTFSFKISSLGGAADADGFNGGDGFAFVIQSATAPALATAGGGSLGYEGIPNSISVEFDTWKNGTSRLDGNGNHISVHTKGTEPNTAHEEASVASATEIANISNGAVHTARITYSPVGAGKLQVFLDGGESPVIDIEIKLADQLSLSETPEWAGFTASTGGAWEIHDITSWTICTPSASVLVAVPGLVDVGGAPPTNTLTPGATLTLADGTAVVGATITFTTRSNTLGTEPTTLCTAETNESGFATCTPADNNLTAQIAAGRGYDAAYAGSPTILAATASAPLIRNSGSDVL